MATIVVTGPVFVCDETTDELTSDPARLRAMDGAEDKDANLADYLDGDLAHLGIEGGDLKLAYNPRKRRLFVVSSYQSPKRLNAKQLRALVAYTRGQWSDGAGECAFYELMDEHQIGIDLSPYRTERQVRAEQHRRGGKSLKPTPALLVAAEKGDLQKVQRLLQQDADVDTRGKRGRTALQTAIVHGQTSVAALLLKCGANPNLADDGGGTALAKAAMRSHTRLAKLLIQNGAIVNSADSEGVTPLMWAANRGQAALVELLLACGADPNAQDRVKYNSGTTPLMYASPGATKVLDLLIANGANPKLRNRRKQTAVEHALQQAHLCEKLSCGDKREAALWRKKAAHIKQAAK